MSHAHIISSRSDYDPSSTFLLVLQIVMVATFGLGIGTLIGVFLIN